MHKNILVTGGAGFIGSNLSLKLVQLGYNVTVLDNLSMQIHGDPQTSPLYLSIKDRVNFIIGDVRDKEKWIKAIKGQDVVIHLAAETGTGQSMYEIHKYVDVNIRGTSILLDIIANMKHAVKKIIVASSRAIYGEGKYFCTKHGDVYPNARTEKYLSIGRYDSVCPVCDGPVMLKTTDEASKIHPTSVYGITKQVQEQLVLNLAASMNISALAFRYQNVYGPGQSLSNPYTGILSIFSTNIRNGNMINIYEDGLESRDFVYIDDAVDATILGIEYEPYIIAALNVGSGVNTSVLTVAKSLMHYMDAQNEIHVSGNYRIGDIRHNYADLINIRKTFGYFPKYNFERGIKEFVNWVNHQKLIQDDYKRSEEELRTRGLFK